MEHGTLDSQLDRSFFCGLRLTSPVQVGTLVGLQLGSFIYFTLFFSGFPAILAYLFFLSLFLFSSSILGIEAVATMVSHGGGMLKRSPCAKFSTNSQWVRGEFGACCG